MVRPMENTTEMQAMVNGDGDTANNESQVKEQREKNEASINQLHSHSQNKNFTKGFADLALLTANVNQLRHVLELQDDTMRTVNIVFLSLSIVLQVIAGALLVVDHSIDITTDKGMKKCKIINSVTQIIMLLIIVLNILVVGLGGPQPNVPVLGSPNCFNSTETEL